MTPYDRLEAYRWAKENFETNLTGIYLCDNLADWLLDNGFTKYWSSRSVKLYFPEFWDQKPPLIDSFTGEWFPKTDIASRHLVLDRCIAECEKLIKKENNGH